MNINLLTESQILSISDLVRSTILYCCKSNKIFLGPEEIENIISDIRYRAISSSGYDSNKPFAPWVRAIAKNYMFDYLKARHERLEKYTPMVLVNTGGDIYEPNYSKGVCRREELADALVSSEKSLEIITEALDSLGYIGQAFWLQYEGYNDQEIAERLGKSNGAIRTRKSNARKKLARDPQIISLCKEYGVKISA